MLARIAQSLYRRFLRPRVPGWFLDDLITHTDNFGDVTWLGRPIWQNVFDLWVMQETIAELKPALLIETGTNRGGSALFFAHLFDLLGHGRVVTIDVERLHDITHPRITFLIGSSVAPDIVAMVRGHAEQAGGPVLVTLDSDHTAPHVRAELDAYAPLVTPGSWCLVQDGVIDAMPRFIGGRPGPRVAVEDFLRTRGDFELDAERSRKFLISHHPGGWLRRTMGS
ncbi:MAG TPA: CmcI family methyltransferase [Gemmataceae bacterium]|nr:CmcI family methyltransferase [Gemmataceae bacterium]